MEMRWISCAALWKCSPSHIAESKQGSPLATLVSCNGRELLLADHRTVMVATTSGWSATSTWSSPTCLSGPPAGAPQLLSISMPCAFSASAMSAWPTEPNRRPSTPALRRDLHRHAFQLGGLAWAAARFSAWACSSSARRASNTFLFSGVARLALPWGIRIVAGVTVLDLDDVAEAAEVHHLFHQNHLHGAAPLMCRSV